jgi:hypothetical protein
MPEFFEVPRPPRIEYGSLLGSFIEKLPEDFADAETVELKCKALDRLLKFVDAHQRSTVRPGPKCSSRQADPDRFRFEACCLDSAVGDVRRGSPGNSAPVSAIARVTMAPAPPHDCWSSSKAALRPLRAASEHSVVVL